jgi:hypothetical protein
MCGTRPSTLDVDDDSCPTVNAFVKLNYRLFR